MTGLHTILVFMSIIQVFLAFATVFECSAYQNMLKMMINYFSFGKAKHAQNDDKLFQFWESLLHV